jgi:hypothetical protein
MTLNIEDEGRNFDHCPAGMHLGRLAINFHKKVYADDVVNQ